MIFVLQFDLPHVVRLVHKVASRNGYQLHVQVPSSGNTEMSVHYSDVIMRAMASEISIVSNVYSTGCSDVGHRQATGLDAWASRVKCPARFVSHLHEICIYIWVVYSLCFFCCLFITVTWWYVWCIEWASGNQQEVQACLVTLWLFIISCYSLYKTTLGLLCSWFENNPHFHKYSMDFHV